MTKDKGKRFEVVTLDPAEMLVMGVSGPSRAVAAQARLVVCSHAVDVTDARMLLDMLGISPHRDLRGVSTTVPDPVRVRRGKDGDCGEE